jgi:hypothetical protein
LIGSCPSAVAPGGVRRRRAIRPLQTETNGQDYRVANSLPGVNNLRSESDVVALRVLLLACGLNFWEGADSPDRDAQFGVINDAVKTAMAENQPAISVDTKKKELVGDFNNAGREWRKQGDPEEVRVHDFLIKELGRAVLYGIYDLAANTGWVNVGIDNDTAAFAVQTIRRWWQEVGRVRYALARRLVITADGGGSNGSRVRLWKLELQRLADELGISIEVHHMPPGTSKWNKIEHRLFSFITQNWRAEPLVSYRVIVELISATTTKTGLTVRCELDNNPYPKANVVSDDEMRSLNIQRADFHGEWNYTITPSTPHLKAVDS